jgi:hypothetical protein
MDDNTPTTTDARRTGWARSPSSPRFRTSTPMYATVAATAIPNGIATSEATATDRQLTELYLIFPRLNIPTAKNAPARATTAGSVALRRHDAPTPSRDPTMPPE